IVCGFAPMSIRSYFFVLVSLCLLIISSVHGCTTTAIYTLSLHDALPISLRQAPLGGGPGAVHRRPRQRPGPRQHRGACGEVRDEIGEHTSELQSHLNLVCRLLLEKKNISRSNQTA